MDGIGGQMKTFCKLTAQSPAASYVPLPRFLLQDETLCDISNDAKVLYALLLDRASISRQNGYVEPDGTIRLYFTLEQAQTKLHRSRQSATRIFRELEYSGLIIRRKARAGQARPHYAELPSGRQTDRQGRSARCADLRPCAVCKPSTYALEITHRLKRQMLWKGGQRWKYF